MLLSGCELYQTKPPDYYHQPKSLFGYDLSAPTKKYFMGFELEEISGLSWFDDGHLACVQDEDGKLYIYNLKDEEVVRRIKFAGPGDFEGVEVLGDRVYVTNNSGDVYTFLIDEDDKVDAEVFKTKLKSRNNVEGLGFDPQNQHLLLACKGAAGLGEKKVKGKAIYQFGLESKKISKGPVARITKKKLRMTLHNSDTVAEAIDFGPSGIAFHPIEKRYYIVSYEGHLMVILDRNKELVDVIRLSPKTYRQPEGICFAPDGTMYISSEGAGGDGYILELAYTPPESPPL